MHDLKNLQLMGGHLVIEGIRPYTDRPIECHAYLQSGTYAVILTIGDARGRSTAASRAVTVTGGTPPTAVLTISPIDPRERDRVFFNAKYSF